jgi:hypothetical protein
MRRILMAVTATMLLLSGALLTGVSAQEKVPDKTGELTVPWDEFKELLNLDEDEIVISLETFQKLLAQTGIKTTPPYTVKESNVVLSRVEFRKLVDQMTPPVGLDAQPPFEYLITKAIYSGKMQNNSTTFTGVFYVHVLKKGAYLKVPLLPQSIALADITVDGEQALVVSEDGYQNVVLSKAGEYAVTASFSLKSSLEKGPHKIDLAVQQTPVTLLKLEIPLRDIDVEIPQAQQLLTSSKGNATVVSAIIAPGRAISMRWRKKVAVTEKIPAKLYSEVYHLISIEDDALKINSDVNYNILHSEVDAVRLAVPDNMNVLSVSGEGVGEWQEIEQQDQRLILIPFTYGKKGGVTVRFTAETPLSEPGLTNVFSGIRVLDTVRETGFVGIALNTSAEVIVTESEGLEEVAPQKLPTPLINKSAKPLIMGFKYLKHPYSLALDIKKHEKIAVPVATVNSANVVTLFTEDGKVVHRLVYQVRNSAKQFLEIQLPEDADVWSVLVDNQPVESSTNAQQKLLVPLIRSSSVGNQLNTFPVEVIFCVVKDGFSWLGSRESSLPAVDLLVSQLMWSVYLPNDYSYIYFSSTLEKEEMIRGVNIFAGAQRQYNERAMAEVSRSTSGEPGDIQGYYLDKDALDKIYKGKEQKSRFRNVPLQEEQISSQVEAELEFSGRLEGLAKQDVPQTAISGGTATGVLPIQIQVPTGGQVYRFAKTIIKTEDPLTFSVVYNRSWVSRTLKWVILLFLILLIYLNRKRLIGPWRWSKEKLRISTDFYREHQSGIKKCAQSIMTPFVLFGLMVVFWSFSKFLTLLFLFLFWVSAVYQILQHWKKKAQAKAKSDKRSKQQRTSD